MVRWVVGSNLHGGPIDLFLVPVIHGWYNKVRGMYYLVYGMMYMKQPLLLIGKRSHVAVAGFLVLHNVVSSTFPRLKV